MPIKPENKKLYPSNWKQIRVDILKRANDRCESCGVQNGAQGYRDENGAFHTALFDDIEGVYKWITIVLTIAHLDHNPTNNDPDNLTALCQHCHNRYDRDHRQDNARRTRRNRKAIKELFD